MTVRIKCQTKMQIFKSGQKKKKLQNSGIPHLHPGQKKKKKKEGKN